MKNHPPISCSVFVWKKEKGIQIPNSFLCFLQKKEKGKRNPSFLIPFVLSSDKGRRNAWFRIPFCFLQKKKKGIHQTEFVFCFLQKKRQKERAFLNSIFLFAAERKKEICHASFNFSFPGRSKYDESCWNSFFLISWTKTARIVDVWLRETVIIILAVRRPHTWVPPSAYATWLDEW